MIKFIYCSLLAGLVVCAPAALRASDSYPAPKQPTMDSEKYALGQKVSMGAVKLPAAADAKLTEKQTPKLKKLQGQLPSRVQGKKNLPSLAGKLTSKQLDSLEYYVQKRYAAK